MRLYGRAALYTGAPGQMVKDSKYTDQFVAGESKPKDSLLCTFVHYSFLFLKGKNYELLVAERNYLRIVQEGNYINFTCMVTDKENKISVLELDNFRLKVQIMKRGVSAPYNYQI